jgi:hypothetical protein
MAALAAAGVLHGTVVGLPEAEFLRRYPMASNGHVYIHNLYGDVRIMVWDREQVQVQAIRKSKDTRRADDARVLVDSSYESFTISTQFRRKDWKARRKSPPSTVGSPRTSPGSVRKPRSLSAPSMVPSV